MPAIYHFMSNQVHSYNRSQVPPTTTLSPSPSEGTLNGRSTSFPGKRQPLYQHHYFVHVLLFNVAMAVASAVCGRKGRETDEVILLV